MSRSIRVLHVEDDEDFAALTADYLETTAEAISIETARDLDAALERLESATVDCIVSDFDLPRADGIELLERVRARDDRLPFILFTGKGSEEVASDALAAGVTDYLQKERGTEQFAVLANRIENAVTRHRAVKELERQNERYERAEEIADIGTWEVDLETEDVWLSRGAYRTLGLSTDYDPDLRSTICHLHPDDRDAVRAALQEAVEIGESVDLEARYVGGDGDYQWVHIRGDPAFEDGEPVSLRATIQDITRHKEREAELERYETVLQAAGDPVYMLDEDGYFTFVNDALEEFVGAPEAELLGTHVSRFVDDSGITRGIDVIETLFEDDGRRRGTLEVEVITADGERVPAEVHVALLPADDDAFSGTVGVVRDVSERQRRQRSLRRFAAVMDAVPVGVFLVDADGVLVEANEEAAAIVEVNKESFVGEDFSKLVDEGLVPQETLEDYEATVRDLLSADSATDVATIETEVTPAAAEETRIVETYVTLLTHEGEFHGSIGILRDVTDERTHARTLERKTERLSELIDIVSHDLRNPLNVAQSRLELARRDGLESEHIDAASDAIERVTAIIDDALTLARLGETVERPRSVELGRLAEHAWSDLGQGHLEIEDDVTVEGDPARLQTALSNLFTNALEHGGESVTVRIGALEGGFYVADDGPGIPADEREDVLDPGYTTRREGTGFGLAIVDHVAAAHGWDVAITESRDGGTRVEFSPTADPADAPQPGETVELE